VVENPTDERITHYILCFGPFTDEVMLRSRPLQLPCRPREWKSAQILWAYGPVDSEEGKLQAPTKMILRREWIEACVHEGKRVNAAGWEVK